MSFPVHPDKRAGQAVLTPQAMIAYRQRSGLLPVMEAPSAVILCLQRGLPERMRGRYPLRRVARLMGDLYLLKRSRGAVAVMTNFGIGAPQMAALAEELIAWGARRLVSLSMAGGLLPELSAGAVVVCTQAIRDEGTSYHYLAPAKYVDADPGLVEDLARAFQSLGIPMTKGVTWTTDGAYRETMEEVRAYQAEGVNTVEMETAALFAVGKARGVQTATVCVVGDSLARLSWELPEDMGPVERGLAAAYAAAIEALSGR
ncbi:MAG TPA: nucleoside phosphorylase [Anaerolineales bacterium]|nr:nucleoside phosphorylase [Anaerolineales bacterium]